MPDDVRLTRSKSSQPTADSGETKNTTATRRETASEQDAEAERYEDAQDDGLTIESREDGGNGGSTSTIIDASKPRTTQISESNVATFRILQKLSKGLTRAHFNKEKLEKLVREGRLQKPGSEKISFKCAKPKPRASNQMG